MKKILLALLLCFGTIAQAAEVRLIQFVHSKLVQPYTNQPLDGPNPFTWSSEVFPYTVPSGYWLGVVDMHLGTKFGGRGGDNARASMLVLGSVTSVPASTGSVSFRVPLVVPEGVTLTASIINNDIEMQWMNSAITAILVPKVAGQSYQEAFAFLFK